MISCFFMKLHKLDYLGQEGEMFLVLEIKLLFISELNHMRCQLVFAT